MNRICRHCNADITDDAAAFCDRCGMPLPPPRQSASLICRQCGRIQSDVQSRFCDRCGSHLTPPATVVPAVPGTIKRMTCPICGSSNTGYYLLFCRKCGSSLVPPGMNTPTGPGSGRQEVCPSCGFPNTGDHLFFCRKCGSALGQEEMGINTRRTGTDQARMQTADYPAPYPGLISKPPARTVQAAAANSAGPLKGGRQKSIPAKRPVSLRKLAIISAIIIFLLIGVAFLTGNLPGLGGSGGNASVMDNKFPAQPAAIEKSGTASGESIGNRATPVFPDLPR